jgi:glycosyltransferase involved in cell wall biosynthesis
LPKIKISVIIFFKDTSEDLFHTLDTVEKAFNSMHGYVYEIILVDDGSSNSVSNVRIFHRNKSIIKIIKLNNSIGISGAILEGLKYCNFDNILPIPGHNLFSTEAIINVCSLAEKGRIVIGKRNNYVKNRPLFKIFASSFLSFIYKKLFFSDVDDIHGLILFKKQDLDKFGDFKARHGMSVLVVTHVLVEGGLLIKTIAPINSNHKNRIDRKFTDSFPHLKSILSVIIALKKAYRIL